MAVINSDTMTSGFIYDPHYRTQCISLNAQAAAVPRGTIVCVKETADGTFDVIGASSGAYAMPYGVLLNDAPANAAAQAADVIVFGDLFKDFVNGVYKAATTSDLTAPIIVALRNVGIVLK